MNSVNDNSIAGAGFPHSEIIGSKLVANSPMLFAGYHVFLRLCLPRHPPYALLYLTIYSQTFYHPHPGPLPQVGEGNNNSQSCFYFLLPLPFMGEGRGEGLFENI